MRQQGKMALLPILCAWLNMNGREANPRSVCPAAAGKAVKSIIYNLFVIYPYNI